MPVKLTYAHHGDACRAANALDLVGDRWTLIVVRELLLGPKRFADLQESVRGITPAVLSERLRSLRQAGIVDQVTLTDLARTRAYAVTEWAVAWSRSSRPWAAGTPLGRTRAPAVA